MRQLQQWRRDREKRGGEVSRRVERKKKKKNEAVVV